MTQRLVIATTNPHKVDEFRALLADVPFTLVSLTELGVTQDVPETGVTFEENAVIKACAYAEITGLLSLADDSGLEIDALDGAPGVYSARFAGPDASYEDRFRILLGRLQGLPVERWTARFRCAITVAEPSGFYQTVEGTIEGRIAESPRGENGFGYDPIFLVPELGKTTAELPPELKNKISHRG